MKTHSIRVGKILATGSPYSLAQDGLISLIGHSVIATSVHRALCHRGANPEHIQIASSPTTIAPQTRYAIEIDGHGCGRITDLGIPGSPAVQVELDVLSAAQLAGLEAETCRDFLSEDSV